jgi:RNA polymerase sigma-70 factor (ECF subfamily)
LSRNLCIDDYRRRRHERAFRFVPLDVETLRDPSDPARRAQSRELWSDVETALSQLDPETATLLTLRDVEGLSYRELEELFDLPSGTVKSRLHRGRRELLRRLELLRQGRAAAAADPGRALARAVGGAADPHARAVLRVVPC